MFGVFPFGGPYFGQAVPLVQVGQTVLDLCDATAVSLMPVRTAMSLEPELTAASLMHELTAAPHCEP